MLQPMPLEPLNFIASDLHDRRRLDWVVRSAAGGPPWTEIRRAIASGKVFIDDQAVCDEARLVRSQQRIELRPRAAAPATATRLASEAIVHVDAQVVVVNKPSGISTVPFEQGEQGSLQQLVRAWLNRTAADRKDRSSGDLGIVHRIDKETSGLVVFTRTLAAKRHLAQQFRVHSVHRRYHALAHGHVRTQTIRTKLVANRGDGIRGSTRNPKLGQLAITHLEAMESLQGATLVRCHLETGRTHQIRIHLAELGSPLVGERVYVRGLNGAWIEAPRIMLHAAELGFVHPTREQPVQFTQPEPEDFSKLHARLRKP